MLRVDHRKVKGWSFNLTLYHVFVCVLEQERRRKDDSVVDLYGD